jgi:NADH-quinone oxidoreductase subunit E
MERGKANRSVRSKSPTGKGRRARSAPIRKAPVARDDGYPSDEVLARVGNKLGIPASRVSEMVDAIGEIASNVQDAENVVGRYRGDETALIQILLEIQREKRWLAREVLTAVCEKLGVPLSRAYRIATFYKAFSLVPQGRHAVSVCVGTACHVRGAPRLLDRVVDGLGVKPGETSSDLKFSLDTVNCLGCCALGPVVVVDGEYYSNPTSKEIGEIVGACD